MTIVFLLLATFILVNLQIYLYQKWGFAHVFYTRQIEDKPIFAGEIVLYKEEIVNKKNYYHFPRFVFIPLSPRN